MSARIELDPGGQNPAAANAGSPPAGALAPVGLDPDSELGHDLPRDHPAWARDAVSLSQRARALFASLRPVAIKVVTYWEHRVRALAIGGAILRVDASGSYRLD